MSVSWTDEQLKAMEPGDGSLLVSAAAGSGKTAVLIERVLRRITDEKDPRDLNEFLIVTYTNAAASEMRYKLAQAIEDRIRETGNDRRLIRQLRLLPGAQIMTVHSFCHYFLRENFQALELSPDFKIADSSELALLKESAIKDVLERAYEESEQNPGFLRLADEFSGMRGDKPLEDVILSLFEKLQSHPFPKLWMEEHRLDFDGAASVGETEYGKYLMGRALKTVESAEKFISDALSKIYGYPALTEKYAPAFEDDLAQLRSLSDMLRKGKWDEAAEFSGGMGFMKLSAVRGFPDAELLESVKAARDMSKKLASVVRDKFLLKKSSEAETEQRSVSCIANELFRLVNAFDEEFSKQKRQRNLVDFSDLEHFAVNILCESYDIKTKACVPSGTALSEASQFAEILIDEYQDTNEVQDLIFKLISKKENNLFMVGDVKQSIYRFRLADPTIFLQKFNTYKDAGEPGENGKRRVILSKNFRSGDSVLDAVNFVFSYLMTGTFGEIKYGEKEYLNKGASYVYEDGEPYKTELLLLSMKTPENMQDTEEEELSKAEAEASMTAERISRMLKGSFMITDADSGEKRAVRPSDIAILLRTVSGKAQIYKSALGARGVPASTGAEAGFFERTEILVMTALLETIDNPRKDIPLIAAMRSPLYGFLEDELADIRVNERDGDFYDAVLKSAEAGNGKCRAFLDDIEEFRSCAVTMSVSRLIFHVYNKTGALGILSALPPGREREKNLLTLYEYAENYEHLSFKGLYSFLQYLKKISESGEIRKAPENASDAVTIMSIHKSKGLEFPVVFLCDCAKQFNEDDLRGRVLMHPGLGIGLFRKDEGGVVEYPTLLRSAVEES
ncbi:MAG: helicase-exonuclease AddAB subunit AddA, partial [Bacillota bacterium]|nr:helicase-exonuclease AddAB subunit AddA [Bacillota bacterium]